MNFNLDLLLENLKNLNIDINDTQIRLLDGYTGLLTEKNKVMNLTSIEGPDESAVKHLADSISVMTAADFKAGSKVIDVGTGAGFPGVPLLIMNPEINLTLLDSTGKKLAFISEALDELGVNAETLHMRAEEAGKDSERREKYDYAVSRAVASLNVLSEYCLPLIKTGGSFIAMKGPKAEDEIREAENALNILGGKVDKIIPVGLTDGAERNLIVIKKTKSTPQKYPRPSAQISKKPL